MIKGVYLLLTY